MSKRVVGLDCETVDSKNGEGYDKILEVIKQENGLVW